MSKTLIDCHVHLAAFPDGRNGCHVSTKILKGPLFRFLCWKHGLDQDQAQQSNCKYVDDLVQELHASQYVGKVVLLGLDGVYERNGRLDLRRTDFLICNDYVLETCQKHSDDFLPGVSINPQRRDALDELERCAAAGAQLVKFLPNSQGFDPSEPRFITFYRTLARLQIPLLSHVGYEFSLIGNDQSAGHPQKLRCALDQGVMVIAAHGCSNGLIFAEPHLKIFMEMVRCYPNFFSDVSALTLPNRFGMLLRLRGHPEMHERLLFGTDYPLSVYTLPAWGRIPMTDLAAIIRVDNRFDRQYLLLKSLKVNFRSLDELKVPL